MFLHVSVILFTGGGGGDISACIAGGIPACLAAGAACSGGGSAPNGGCLLQGVLLWGVSAPGGRGVWRPPKNQTATVADGTHPIGMHSCP